MEFSHETDEQLELYALGRLPEPRVAAVEEHLLVCFACQERLDEVETFALAMRQAVAGEPEARAHTSWFRWPGLWFGRLRLQDLRPPAFIWAGGFTALLLAAGLYFHSGRNVAPLASLQLTAIRGDIQSATPAQETDITLADAPAGTALRGEVVDATGGPVWNGPLEGDAPKIKLLKPLTPGNYFVRLFDNTGKLLHEYGFRVRDVL